MTNSVPHLVHRTFRPALSAGAFSPWLQDGQRNDINSMESIREAILSWPARPLPCIQKTKTTDKDIKGNMAQKNRLRRLFSHETSPESQKHETPLVALPLPAGKLGICVSGNP